MKPIAMLVLLALSGGAQAAQLYRWTDEEGRVHYSDQRPPKTAKTAEVKKLGDKPTDPNMPYALQQATKNFPVTLYNSDCGDACSQASALLSKRGLPFTERNAREAEAAEALTKLTGGKLEVPTLVVGRQVIRGYEETGWHSALDAAGYPKSGILPPRSATKQAQAPAAAPQPAQQAAQPTPPQQ